ncbi:MAG TPA: N-acetylmuramoyl-L-alanine amidase [Dongiaceae bacterium]|nr:N-acetylmuramoyl-L-alanine amidase [Dongiaceae bacterium]
MVVLRRLILLVLVLIPVSAWAKPAVTDARVGAEGDTTRVELQLSDNLHFRSFYLPDPDRIVIDLDEVDWRVAAGHKLQGTGLVTALRYGLFKVGTSRVVIDLQQPAAVADIGVRQSALVIDLRPISPADFQVAVRTGTPPNGATSTTAARAGSDQGIGAPAKTVVASAANAATVKDLGKNAAKADSPADGQSAGTLSTTGQSAHDQAARDQAANDQAAAQPAVPPTPMAAGSRAVSASKSAKSKAKTPDKPMVVIDAGHGGVDPGALGDGVMEKNVTLAVALSLKKELLASGRYRVKLTRETDVYIPLRDRFKVARDSGADLFISLHADSHNDPFMRGASVYTLSETASDAEAADLANQENKSDIIAGVDLSKQSGMVTDILIDLAQRDTINQSNTFAVDLVSELKSDTLMLEHSHRSAGFAVLKAPDVPSVLIEMGYISSQKDQALLTDKQHQSRLAKSIRRAIDDYFSNREPTRGS